MAPLPTTPERPPEMALRPCLGLPGMPSCGKLATGGHSRCPSCRGAYNRARDLLRGSPTQRGLGSTHRAQVKALIEAYIAEHGHTPNTCPMCSRDITKSNPITGQHTVPRAQGGTHADTLLCLSCNSSEGARVRRTQTQNP
ncbi:MAG TPA: hypothetical protein DGT23_18740 [Micromonosporaceae bacterium]|nr:hypothetical protein [Micromonosporaceae bacterium]